MKSRLLIVGLMVVAVVAGYLAWRHFAGDPHEPVYKEKRLSAWIKQLRTGSDAQKQQAIEALAALGEKAEPAIPDLLQLLDNGSLAQQIKVANALAEIGPATKGAIPTLVRLLRKTEEPGFRTFARTLTVYGDEAKSAAPVLVDALKSNDPEKTEDAARALAGIGPAVFPEIYKAIKSENPILRVRATAVLGMMRRHGKPALPELKKLLDDPDAFVRTTAAESIKRIEEAKE